MAFNLYFAGSEIKGVQEYIVEKKLCRLFSQANERKSILKYWDIPKDSKPRLMVDSGAFTEAHTGKKIDIDKYIDFINANDEIADIWVELDSIPYPVLNKYTAKKSAEKSWNNYLYMMDRVKSPDKLIPLYHFGEPKQHLIRILNTPVLGHLPPYIGIGGRHGVSTKEQEEYFDKIFDIVKNSDNPNVKIHVFGMTVFSLLELYPFYSADSTTWLQNGINGRIITNYGIYPISERSNFDKYCLLNYSSSDIKHILEEIDRRGYTFEQLRDDYKARLRYNIDYYVEWANNYQYKPKISKHKKLF